MRLATSRFEGYRRTVTMTPHAIPMAIAVAIHIAALASPDHSSLVTAAAVRVTVHATAEERTNDTRPARARHRATIAASAESRVPRRVDIMPRPPEGRRAPRALRTGT